MTKKEQIEEMARAMCEHFDVSMKNQPCTKCRTYNKNCYTIHKAEVLYNKGYRKINDNGAVITKDELKQYQTQAVKEFAEKLKEKFNGYEATYYNGHEVGFHDLQEEIDELLKEYEK